MKAGEGNEGAGSAWERDGGCAESFPILEGNGGVSARRLGGQNNGRRIGAEAQKVDAARGRDDKVGECEK